MREVDGLLWRDPPEAVRSARLAAAVGGQVLLEKGGTGPSFLEWRAKRRLVWWHPDIDVAWVAPWWIAWLYRLLPYDLSWKRGPAYDSARLPAFYLWSVHAPAWHLALVPCRRNRGYGARWGVLVVGGRRFVL